MQKTLKKIYKGMCKATQKVLGKGLIKCPGDRKIKKKE